MRKCQKCQSFFLTHHLGKITASLQDIGGEERWVALLPPYVKTSAQAAVTNLELQITEFTTAKDEKKVNWKTLQATYKKTVDEIKETLRRNKVQIEGAKKMATAD